MGLFDPEPKRKKNEFFDKEEELRAFLEAVGREKLIVVTGLRRYGKTSLILTGLNESGREYVFVDCRLLPSGMVSLRSFLDLLRSELSRKSWARRLLELLGGFSISTQLTGVNVGLESGRARDKLLEVLRGLEGRVLVLDEAQELRRSGFRFDKLLAYAYDHLDLTIVVSGSQVGLLYRFLRVRDPDAPLYGRPYREVRVSRLEQREAREILRKGFEEEGVRVDDRLIEEAVEALDGIIGWLAYFGYMKCREGLSLAETLETASRMAASEVEKTLEVYGPAKPRYLEALRVVATLGEARWSEIKRGVESRLGRVPNNTLAGILKNLVDAGLLEKVGGGYRVPDPLVRRAVARGLVA